MFKKFNYKTLQNLQQDIENLGIDLNLSNNFNALKKPVQLGSMTIPNSVAAHPMEGGDSDVVGNPTDLTFRKYERVAQGGFGLIWFEAVSVCKEGRSNAGQLWINDKTLPGFKELINRTLKAAETFHPAGERPLLIMQLNHSGRYSKPKGKSAPIIASHIPELDARLGIDETYPLVTDEYLDGLVAQFVKAAVLAKEAGFDGVDVKACHGYLLHELLSCHNRDGKYGGSFENRVKLMLRIIDEIRAAIPNPNFIIASRINIFDALPVSHGFGMAYPGSENVDLTEPIKLTQLFVEKGVELVSITMGNPYFIPHINRPYDLGAYEPKETPLQGVYRLIKGAADLQKAVPVAKIVGVGYSWFRGFSPYVAAAVLEEGKAAMIGYGRQILSYPDVYKDIVGQGWLNPSKVCVSCSKCSFLKRNAGTCGCVVRDAEAYLPLYKETYNK
ncbi:MAG: NADH:flavin oxidoreductase [Firmicutes bacterium]|nr:NADH:flavin oxidoreductase [Bacillota bacterium]